MPSRTLSLPPHRGSLHKAELPSVLCPHALPQLEPLWDELFPAEQGRIIGLLVDRVTVSSMGADIRLRVEGLASLVRDLGAGSAALLKAAE